MDILLTLQNRLRNSVALLAYSAFLCYFVFHSFSGERGLVRYLYLKSEISAAKTVSNSFNMQKTELESKVRLLSNSSLDLDLLEERARIVLNLAGADEFIILDE